MPAVPVCACQGLHCVAAGSGSCLLDALVVRPGPPHPWEGGRKEMDGSPSLRSTSTNFMVEELCSIWLGYCGHAILRYRDVWAMLTTISFTTVQGIKTRRENYSVFIHQVLVIISLGVRPEGQRFLHVSSLGSRGRSPSHNFQG